MTLADCKKRSKEALNDEKAAFGAMFGHNLYSEKATLGMMITEPFIGKLLTINRLATCAISISKVATLHHKALNNTMESRSLIG
mmetsp:Transcript_11798/g.10086  ORF Transcript_11798/g.10086 Transcript_11798/m.10086 type:complete len:84 (+) Transcript_11798:411-662(+)